MTKSLKLKTDFSRRIKSKSYNRQKYIDSNIASFAPFDNHKCIFIHVPKTAGKAINESLFGHETSYHKPITYFIDHWSKPIIWWYFKFAFVRNPYDRLISTFAYYKGGGESERDATNSEELLGNLFDVNDFVDLFLGKHKGTFFETHLRPQHSFLVDEEKQIRMNFIGKFESLEEDYKKVAKKLRITQPLKRTNVSHKKFDLDLNLVLTDTSREKIFKFYKQDFGLFNYST